jgi:hypothetical protein
MLIYLDTKDLINILQKSDPCSIEKIKGILKCGGHKLVYSMINILELSEPLLNKRAETNVMTLLNTLESLPHVFIHSACIHKLELEQASKAFERGIEYEETNPFVRRFDQTIDLNAAPPTRFYLNYSLAETVWDLYRVDAIGMPARHSASLKKLVAADRALSPSPSLHDGFVETIRKAIATHKIKCTFSDTKSFASWIYANPIRCPSIRLGYELWHKIVRNVGDQPIGSDLEDFHHIDCLPYVDAITLDKRMRGYVSQVSFSMKVDYSEKTFGNLKTVLNKIANNSSLM